MAKKPHKKRTIRYQTKFKLAGCPLVSIAFGPDDATGEGAGWARGVIAIGDYATGFIAIGGLAAGVISVGGVSLGALSVGGLALGGLILGGAAVGVISAGGAAVGYYARGGAVFGTYVASPHRQDPEALTLFNTILPGSLKPLEKAADKAEDKAPTP